MNINDNQICKAKEKITSFGYVILPQYRDTELVSMQKNILHLDFVLGTVQKLRNGQRGEGVDDFVTYRYVYLRGRGVFHEVFTYQQIEHLRTKRA